MLLMSEGLPHVLADCLGNLIVRDTAHIASTAFTQREVEVVAWYSC
jgi:hypothetical protein